MLLRRLALPLIAAVVLVTGSSCFDILETIRVNKDGSGEYVLDLDMSEALQLLSGFMAMDTTDDMAKAMEEVMDTTMRFADAPDSARMAWRYPEVTARASMNVRMDGPAETLTMSVRLPFDSPEDIDRFGADLASTEDLGLMDAVTGGGDGGDGQGGSPPMLFGEDQFRSAKGRLTRRAVDASNLLGGSDGDEESMDMMKMFLSGATYTVVYELPGKVKKVSADDVTVEGKRVTMVRDLLELMEGESDLSIDIRYQ